MKKVFSWALPLVFALTVVQSVGAHHSSVSSDCDRWQGHTAEACAAYIFWDAHTALQAYFKYVKSDSLFAGSKDLFPKRYKGNAPVEINRVTKVSTWPAGTNSVQGPDISILAAQSSLACNRAVLVTSESWVVHSPSQARPLYSKNHQVFTVVLRRVPGEIFVLDGRSLHAWDVYDIRQGRPSAGWRQHIC